MEKELRTTRQDMLFDYINSSLITTLYLIFSLWWVTKVASIKNAPRKGLRILANLLYFISAFSLFFCDWLIVFLSTQMEINKNTVEKLGYLEGMFIFSSKEINLVELYNLLLFVGQILKISTIYLLTSSWVPFTKSKSPIDKNTKQELLTKLSEASIISFTKYYAIFRVPFFVFLRMYQHLFDNDTILFLRSVIFGCEIVLCALFLVILKTKYQSILHNENDGIKGNYCGINILILVLILDSFFNHILHTLSIPIVFSELIAYIVEKLGFLSQLLCNIVLLTLLCPQFREDYFEKNKSCKVDIIPYENEDYKSESKRMEIESYELVDVIGPSEKVLQQNS